MTRTTGEIKYVQETPRFEKENLQFKLWNQYAAKHSIRKSLQQLMP